MSEQEKEPNVAELSEEEIALRDQITKIIESDQSKRIKKAKRRILGVLVEENIQYGDAIELFKQLGRAVNANLEEAQTYLFGKYIFEVTLKDMDDLIKKKEKEEKEKEEKEKSENESKEIPVEN